MSEGCLFKARMRTVRCLTASLERELLEISHFDDDGELDALSGEESRDNILSLMRYYSDRLSDLSKRLQEK